MLTVSVNIQYFRNLICGKALRQRETLYAEAVSATIAHLIRIILGFGTYFFLFMRCRR